MTVTLFVRNQVRDYDTFRPFFDASADFTASRGVLSSAVHRDVDDPDRVVITHQFATVDEARAMAALFDEEEFHEGPVKVGGAILRTLEFWIAEDA